MAAARRHADWRGDARAGGACACFTCAQVHPVRALSALDPDQSLHDHRRRRLRRRAGPRARGRRSGGRRCSGRRRRRRRARRPRRPQCTAPGMAAPARARTGTTRTGRRAAPRPSARGQRRSRRRAATRQPSSAATRRPCHADQALSADAPAGAGTHDGHPRAGASRRGDARALRPARRACGARARGRNNAATLFVGDLPPEFGAEDVEALFGGFAAVAGARVIGAQCYAFVEFDSVDEAEGVLEQARARACARGPAARPPAGLCGPRAARGCRHGMCMRAPCWEGAPRSRPGGVRHGAAPTLRRKRACTHPARGGAPARVLSRYGRGWALSS